MNLIKKTSAKTLQNAKTCVAHEYDLGSKDLNVARIELSGRYPEEGYVENEVCTEIVYVLSGSGKAIFKSGEEMVVEVGDAILFEKNEQYFWEGNCSLLISCSPAWYPEQHKIIEE